MRMALLPGLCALAACAGALPVYEAVDGDTVRVLASGETLRLEAIDAPERGWRADCREEAVMAEDATALLAAILAEGVVVEDSGKDDRYGRALVTLRTPTGFTASDLLIHAELAVPWAGRRHEWC